MPYSNHSACESVIINGGWFSCPPIYGNLIRTAYLPRSRSYTSHVLVAFRAYTGINVIPLALIDSNTDILNGDATNGPESLLRPNDRTGSTLSPFTDANDLSSVDGSLMSCARL